jgi:cathepsin C
VNDGNGKGSLGSWTMVYDEGFEILHKNVKYFAFSKYEPTGTRDFNSLCGETLIGWYNNLDNGSRGCYRASKTSEAI